METGSLSVFLLIANADFIVQMVMLILLIASVFSWSIVFDKIIKLRKQIRKADIFEQYFWSGQIIENVYNNLKNKNDGALVSIFVKSVKEFKRLHNSEKHGPQAVKEKVKHVIETECKNIIGAFEQNIDWLATIGSTAPFVGLLGTVWGIMSSFQSIAMTKNTTLSVVAPSIAEALLATAAGLLVAIPAVIFYNRIVIKIDNFSNRIDSFALNLQLLLMKGLDE